MTKQEKKERLIAFIAERDAMEFITRARRLSVEDLMNLYIRKGVQIDEVVRRTYTSSMRFWVKVVQQVFSKPLS